MKACFLIPDRRPSGGTSVVLGHAERLGADVIAAGEEPSGAYDVAVATWWETAERLFEVDAARRAVFLQSLEHRFYGPDQPWERMGAAAVLGLPVAYIGISAWIRDVMAEVRPDAPFHPVPNGIDKEVFGAVSRSPAEGPLRVLVEGQAELPFKGVAEALAAVAAMCEPVALTRTAPTDGLDPMEMAELYSRQDVLLKLARVEGLGLGPIEAFHGGVPCVVTPYTGSADYVRDGQNGLVVPFDDVPATAAALDRLAADRDLLERLGAGALDMAAAWPSRDVSAELMGEALAAIAAGPAPAPGPAMTRLLAGLRVEAEVGREQLAVGRRAAERVAALEARIEEITGTPAYRAAAAVKRRLRP